MKKEFRYMAQKHRRRAAGPAAAASCEQANRIINATAFYTVKDDGLTRPWFGRIWLNPPYGRHAPKFIAKFTAEYRSGVVTAACLLLATHHMTSKWFAALYDFAPLACLPEDRLRFSDTKRVAHGSVLLGIGTDPRRFRAAFSPFGRVFEL